MVVSCEIKTDHYYSGCNKKAFKYMLIRYHSPESGIDWFSRMKVFSLKRDVVVLIETKEEMGSSELSMDLPPDVAIKLGEYLIAEAKKLQEGANK